MSTTLAHLAKALKAWAVHDDECSRNQLYSPVNHTCTCGLTALQQQLAEELANQPKDPH